MSETELRCRDCGRPSNDWYWFNHKGQKLSKPRCPECHAQFVRGERTEIDYDHEEGGVIKALGQEQRVRVDWRYYYEEPKNSP